MTDKTPVITIDGPSGAGKGTLSRMVADRTGYLLLDSGALYRLTGVACLNKHVDMSDHPAVAKIAGNLDVQFIAQQGITQILLEGLDVTQKIREEAAGMAASQAGANPLARDALLVRQRAFRQAPGLVADGRDMGTVVFPDAQVKIFLTASAEERAKRRVEQLEIAGIVSDYEKILSDIRKRDHQDMSRKVAPLKPARDAVTLDSTAMSIKAVFEAIMAEIDAVLV